MRYKDHSKCSRRVQPPFVCTDSSHMQTADKNAALIIQYHSSSSQNFTFLYVYKCVVDQNAYNKASDTFINYKMKLKLSFLLLQNNDAIIQLSWGIQGDD